MSLNNQYALNWSDHSNHLKKAFDTLLSGNEFVDVTLSCEGKKITAHKMLLSACSAYFYDLFRDNPCQHPIVILRDVKFQNLVNVVKFMYVGEVNLPAEDLDDFVKTAKAFQIIGLPDEDTYVIEKEVDANRTTVEVQTFKTIVEDEMRNEIARKRPNNVEEDEDNVPKKLKEEVTYSETEIKEEFNTVVEETNFFNLEQHEPTGVQSIQPVTDEE
ncbi:hypothetical protein FQA39_LY14537 [Lamprigera yunnana]|nr:hypothetical protein FQA39_LY14537 [Lamprigera yunnana]